jgi:prephenate dehydrogenase
VIGIGRRPESLRKAVKAKAVDHTTQDLAAGVGDAELVVVCTPIDTIAQHVYEAAAACPEGALLTDAGSTKASIARRIEKALPRTVGFVGSHPLAGSEKTGCEHARANLFEGRTVVVTPTLASSKQDVHRTTQFWTSLGAKVLTMAPSAHDFALAFTSHLPHLIASALSRATLPKQLPLTAGGWRDCTRIAAGDAELWTQILLDNRDNLLKSLDKFETMLAGMRSAIEERDRRRLEQLLNSAKQIRDAVGS